MMQAKWSYLKGACSFFSGEAVFLAGRPLENMIIILTKQPHLLYKDLHGRLTELLIEFFFFFSVPDLSKGISPRQLVLLYLIPRHRIYLPRLRSVEVACMYGGSVVQNAMQQEC